MGRSSIDQTTRARSRRLRREMTHQEVKLWLKLRELNRLGAGFRRQGAIGPYIADFVWFTARLVIEVDGDQHGNLRQATDLQRDDWLRQEGFIVQRFWNHEIDGNLDGVMQAISERIQCRLEGN
ncbi:endonuclease domain-containing protein [Methylobrevis pamukkalensis]|uniref:DUF559 domain-containing protein n=1 Tax=Methylobrevis pamukkalensis TaxID=1439726 RepID=A0A1E3GYJ1_9HYPH|nr:endonuclease domain-containing protein [Methylobrevis pamukkalensis]ODN68401.1 hypothetical protein A6302_04297 [Methylobrevis pamukkalensis]